MTTPWHDYQLEIGDTVTFELGTIHAAITRSQRDWTLEYEYEQDRYVITSAQKKSRVRAAFEATGPQLTVRPACASRNVVATPTDTIRIPPSESTTLFLSSPLWVQFVVHEAQTVLADLPVQIMSDTWFGPNTREGELCYSNETNARIYVENLPVRPERVITPVRLINEGTDPVILDRINLPLPMLSIYRVSEGVHWTQEIIVRRSTELDEATLELFDCAPDTFQDAVKVAESRLEKSGGSIKKTLAMLFR